MECPSPEDVFSVCRLRFSRRLRPGLSRCRSAAMPSTMRGTVSARASARAGPGAPRAEHGAKDEEDAREGAGRPPRTGHSRPWCPDVLAAAAAQRNRDPGHQAARAAAATVEDGTRGMAADGRPAAARMASVRGPGPFRRLSPAGGNSRRDRLQIPERCAGRFPTAAVREQPDRLLHGRGPPARQAPAEKRLWFPGSRCADPSRPPSGRTGRRP